MNGDPKIISKSKHHNSSDKKSSHQESSSLNNSLSYKEGITLMIPSTLYTYSIFRLING